MDRGERRDGELTPMNKEKIREIAEHLEFVDDRYTHKVRAGTSGSLVRLGPEELERRHREMADYVVELKETLRQLLQALQDD